MKTIVKVDGLRYVYPSGVKALEDISFDLYEGEILTLLGPNGSGKTTILKCLLRILKPFGAVYIDGERRWDYLNRRELAKFFGYVPQAHYSTFPYKVRDYIAMGRAPYHGILSLPSNVEYIKVEEIAKMLNIEELLERTIAELSGGQLQMVLIARALIQEAKVLLLDEPTAHLDVSNAVKVLETVRKIIKEGIIKAAVMTLHDPMLTGLYSDKVALIKDGGIVDYGCPDNVLNPDSLNFIYGVFFDVFKRENRLIVLPLGEISKY